MYGYHGRLLKVNLETNSTEEIRLTEAETAKYIGGATLAAALIYDHLGKIKDPLGPESPLVFATGPFTGTSIPMVSRYAVCGISPLTGYWGEATSGGTFPFRLKGAGYDGLFIIGKAKTPVYLQIENGTAQIKDAKHLWGLDIYETQNMLKKELDADGFSTACIGPAGERGIKYAAIMNDRGRAAGRCGLGALMGSKNLKAVVASGKGKTEIAEKENLKALTKKSNATIRENLVSLALKEYGTLFYMDMGMALGDVPAQYFQKAVFPAEKLSGQALRQAYTVENYACLGCPVGCGREVKNFKDDIKRVDGPEYETVGAFGPLCMNFDFDSIVEANHICNANGLDTISTGVSIAYAMDLFERGVLSKDEIGMELKWGDGPAVVQMVKMIVGQEGIGDLLSKGTLAMARELGRDPGEAAQVKGLEMPMHDARAFHGMAVSYATGPRGACHLKGDQFNVDVGGAVPEFKLFPGNRLSSKNKAPSAAKYQSLRDLYDALTLCKFAPLSVTQITQILGAITGKEISPGDLLAAGERSINLKRAINNRLGLTRDGDQLPKVCLKEMEDGSTAGSVPDMELLLKDYYDYRGWVWETGLPSKEKLMELDLDHVAGDLYP